MAGSHSWSFSTIGGVKRVNIRSGKDLVHLHELDQKLWTALSCPVDSLEIDKETLVLVDRDGDGQIRVPDVLEAVNWMLAVLNNPDALLKEAEEFPVSLLNAETVQGKVLLDSAKVILRNIGKESDGTLTVSDTSDTVSIFAGTKFNGDGVITEDTVAGAEEHAALLKEIMQCIGSVADRNGKQGVVQEMIDSFYDECTQYADWQAKREADLDAILPFGDTTAAAYDSYLAIKAKVEDFFLRCRLAAFDPQTTETLNLKKERLETITNKDLSGCIDEIATYPVASVRSGEPFPLSSGLNPAWEQQVHTFKTLVADKLFPAKDALSEAEWIACSQKFAGFAGWNSSKAGAKVEPLGLDRVKAILAGNGKEALTALVTEDKTMEGEANNIIKVDQLVRYHRDLFKLLRNFVTFYDFYDPGSKAIFQAGTLYIDQRSCDLCINVRDMGRHNKLASISGMYLVYCDCVSKSTGRKMTIVAALTNGDVDDLIVGRNALFYDRKGQDWDATIVKIVENPISIRQAFFAPYRKVSRFVEQQVNKAAAAADEKSTASIIKGVEETPGKVAETKDKKEATPTPAFDVAKFAGIFAAIGLALGAIGTMLTAIVTGFLKLTWWQMPLAIIGMLLVISGPSMILAYVKLRKRNLAPVLDANGWAINARVRVNIQFGRTLTHLATLPGGAHVSHEDPFKKRSPLGAILVIILLAAAALWFLWKRGLLG